MTKAIAFDMGGVLLDLDDRGCADAFRRLGFKDIDKILDNSFQKGFWGEFEMGTIGEREFVDACLSHCDPGLWFSYLMKVRKPTAEYFGKVVAGTGLRPEEIVFVDDAQSNVDAAAALGFQAVRFVPGSDLRKTLEAYI